MRSDSQGSSNKMLRSIGEAIYRLKALPTALDDRPPFAKVLPGVA